MNRTSHRAGLLGGLAIVLTSLGISATVRAANPSPTEPNIAAAISTLSDFVANNPDGTESDASELPCPAGGLEFIVSTFAAHGLVANATGYEVAVSGDVVSCENLTPADGVHHILTLTTGDVATIVGESSVAHPTLGGALDTKCNAAGLCQAQWAREGLVMTLSVLSAGLDEASAQAILIDLLPTLVDDLATGRYWPGTGTTVPPTSIGAPATTVAAVPTSATTAVPPASGVIAPSYDAFVTEWNDLNNSMVNDPANPGYVPVPIDSAGTIHGPAATSSVFVTFTPDTGAVGGRIDPATGAVVELQAVVDPAGANAQSIMATFAGVSLPVDHVQPFMNAYVGLQTATAGTTMYLQVGELAAFFFVYEHDEGGLRISVSLVRAVDEDAAAAADSLLWDDITAIESSTAPAPTTAPATSAAPVPAPTTVPASTPATTSAPATGGQAVIAPTVDAFITQWNNANTTVVNDPANAGFVSAALDPSGVRQASVGSTTVFGALLPTSPASLVGHADPASGSVFELGVVVPVGAPETPSVVATFASASVAPENHQAFNEMYQRMAAATDGQTEYLQVGGNAVFMSAFELGGPNVRIAVVAATDPASALAASNQLFDDFLALI